MRKPLLPLEDALAAVRQRVVPLGAEEVLLAEAHGRVLAGDVSALRDQPAHDISMMDGYALRLADAAAGVVVVGEIAAGDAPWTRSLAPGEGARIFTGAPVPPGAELVVMQEQVERAGDRARILETPRPGQHVRRRGEELRAGARALCAGQSLGAAELALCAACGVALVPVRKRPRVALLATGDELVPPGAEPRPGQLVESNTLTLAALCREAGAEPLRLGIAGDDPQRIAARLREAEADVLITTGGASVGAHDHAQTALELLSGELVFHSVAIRPGKPILFGVTAAGQLLFGLPGNPAAGTLCFELFVRLALRMLQGDPHPARTRVRAVLEGGAPLGRVKGQVYFPRGRLFARGAELCFTPGNAQSSMQIGSWSAVNAAAVIPPGEGSVAPGEELEVMVVGSL